MMLILFALALAQSGPVLGRDAAACDNGGGPAIRAEITGLKDRKGIARLEIYPPNATDFLADDEPLTRAGKTFRRIDVKLPASGPVTMCIRVPRPGRYALAFLHDRDANRKFNAFGDGAGFPSNQRIGRARPKLAIALIEVGGGVTPATIRTQYLRGLRGFAPL